MKAELQDYFLWEGKLCQVISINRGDKSIGFKEVGSKPCPTCGEEKWYDVIESSPLFQENAKPINTIK